MAYEGVGSGRSPRPTSAGIVGGGIASMLRPPTPPQSINLGSPGVGVSGGVGGGYSGGGYVAPAVAAPPRLSDDDWLNQDSQYQASLKALEQKLRDFEVENTSAKTKGAQDYQNSLMRLGWIAPTGDQTEGSWNADDRTTSYGNAYQGQMGDFASRGLLRSTLYDQARNDLLGNYVRQKTDMDTSQTNFLEELARVLSGRQSDTQLGKDQARVEALARRAAADSGVRA